MTLALETHKGPTQNAEAMLALMGDVDHPHVRLNFDTGNIAYYNEGVDPCDELEQGQAPGAQRPSQGQSRRLRGLVLSRPWATAAASISPASGEILDGVGFAGPYTIEIEGIGGEPEPGLEGRHERVRRSVAHLRACGYDV